MPAPESIVRTSGVIKEPSVVPKTPGLQGQSLGAPSSTPLAPSLKGWPQELAPHIAWDGSEFRHDEQYTYILSREEIEEIEAALRHFKGTAMLRTEHLSRALLIAK